MGTAINISDVTRSFGLRKALDRLSFSLPQGAFLSVFGHNGAGKSTLLRILTTLDHPSSGAVEILGLNARKDADKIRERIGYISHNPMLYGDMTAEENLLFFARLYGVNNPQLRVRDLLDDVELAHRRLDTVRTFSRGMTQRLAIARALLHDPELVFLDEPYAGLDPHAVEILDGLLASIRSRRTFVMVSHNLSSGYAHASHVLLLSHGRAVCFESTQDLALESLTDLYRRDVSEGVF
ncbi:MAG: ABC transporter ATP-binding protein [Coriobacteriaceae bacterium]|nr:ABC transporter ATP-binding protein [Coriobacteriaceae bacterium]